MRKILKYIGWILGGLVGFILILLLLIGLLIQTKPVKKRVLQFAEKQASATLNGELTVGELEGNFFTHLTLKNALLTNEDDTLAFLKSIELNYNLWPLLNRELQIHSIRITEPYFYLKQQADSSWNVQHLVKPSESEPDTVESSGAFAIDIERFDLVEGNIRIDAMDTIIPKQIQDLNTQLNVYYSSEKQELELTDFSLVTYHPNFQLQQLAFDFSRTLDAMQLSNFKLKTTRNQLEGKAEFEDTPERKGQADFEADSLQISEFEFFLSEFNLPASPVFKLDAKLDKNAVSATIDLSDQEQIIHFDISSNNLAEYIFGENEVLLQYTLSGKLENIDLAHWLGDPELDYLINGELNVDGKGTDPKTATINLAAKFKDCVFYKKPVDELMLDMHLANGDLQGIAEGNGNFGSFWLKPAIHDLQGEPTYVAELKTNKLNLAELLGNDSLQSNINLEAKLDGKGFDPKIGQTNADIHLSKSRLQKIELDTLFANIHYQHENIKIDSLRLETESLTVEAQGNYSLRSNSDIRLTANIEGIDELASFIPVEDLKTSGKIDAHIWGQVDSLAVESSIDLGATSYSNMTLERLRVNAQGLITPADTTIHARLSAHNFLMSGFALDSIAFDVDARPDSVFLDGTIANSDLQSQLKAGVSLGDSLQIALTEWMVDYKDQHWQLEESPAIFKIDSTKYEIDQFKMISGAADSSQYLMAQGKIRTQGAEDFKLEATNIDVAKLMNLLNQDLDISGLFNLKMNVAGTASDPTMKGHFSLDKAVMNEYRFTDFGGEIDYSGSQMKVQAQIVPQDSGRIELAGRLPFQLKLDSMTVGFNPKDSIDATLTVERFPLAVLQTVDIAENIRGTLEGAVNVKGTVESPDPTGDLRLENASINIPEYGIDYRAIRFNLDFQRDQVLLDTLLIRTEDGTLTGSGSIDFNSDFYKGNVSNSQINLTFDRFNPVNHKQFNMEVSGDASLGGTKDEVAFDGDLNIPQAEIYLPAIFNLMGKMNAPEMPKPILVKELEKMTALTDTQLVGQINTTSVDTLSFDYFDQLTGELRIKIPKNTWIKNEDMHIEISGDLEMIKHKEFLELFGSVEVVRGQYDLLGRTFMIESGTITFEGGEEMMPRLNITANYQFRNADRVQQELSVDITGTAENPSVNFTLDGSSVSEGDALSYILFGKSMNELTMDQQENVAGAGDMAGKAAASILSSQLTSFLGDKLDVDYIEVKSDGNFDNATVVVGKYITNDLFVSYEQRFGETNEKDMAKYEVKLEYELFKFLFFQLNNSSTDSGFDVIFKLDSE